MWICPSHRYFEWFIDVLRDVERKDITNVLEMHIFITQFFHKFDLRTTMLVRQLQQDRNSVWKLILGTQKLFLLVNAASAGKVFSHGQRNFYSLTNYFNTPLLETSFKGCYSLGKLLHNH